MAFQMEKKRLRDEKVGEIRIENSTFEEREREGERGRDFPVILFGQEGKRNLYLGPWLVGPGSMSRHQSLNRVPY